MFKCTLAVIVLAALSVQADPLFRIPLKRGPSTAAPSTRAAGPHKVPLTNFQNAQYYGEVSVGTPPQKLHVVFDTATSATWLASSECSNPACFLHSTYVASSSKTYKKVGTAWSGLYSNGLNVTGFLSQDSLAVGDLAVTGQVFAEATGFTGVTFFLAKYDGYVGLNYAKQGGVAPFLENLVEQKVIDSATFGVFLSRDVNATVGGELTLGGYDSTRFSGDLTWVKLASEKGWFVNLDGATAGKAKFPGTLAQVNAGTALIGLPMDQADQINLALNGTKVYEGEYTFDCATLDQLPPVTFDLAGKSFSLEPADYTLVTQTPLGPFCFSAFEGLTFDEGVAPYWVLGDAFLGRFYSAYDATSGRVGFAPVKVSA